MSAAQSGPGKGRGRRGGACVPGAGLECRGPGRSREGVRWAFRAGNALPPATLRGCPDSARLSHPLISHKILGDGSGTAEALHPFPPSRPSSFSWPLLRKTRKERRVLSEARVGFASCVGASASCERRHGPLNHLLPASCRPTLLGQDRRGDYPSSFAYCPLCLLNTLL